MADIENATDPISVLPENLSEGGQRAQSLTSQNSGYHHKKNQQAPSIFIRSIRSFFGFRKTTLTLLSLITIVFVISSVPLAHKRSFQLPGTEPHILSTSWLDLQTISQKPHTYISRANDDVHDYILSRARALAKTSSFISVSDDVDVGTTLFKIRKSWWNSTSEFSPLHFYESNNILVKIEGKDKSLEGVLLSAHYDSVPTGYGSTDDGAGIASLLGILEHYAITGDRPIRTIIFNFNNNEEFGLFGADAFFEHPWSKLVKYFINLEGTGTGAERAILFRTTDFDVAKFYSNVRSPFGSSIFQQGFATGLVKSETDYRVYANNGLRGFDIAFYKPRAFYHTASDAIKYTSKNALWHMLSNTLDLTIALSNASKIGKDNETQAIFFDILGLTFVSLPNTALYTLNIFLLVATPLSLLFFGVIISKRSIWSTGISWIYLPISIVISGFGAHLVNQIIFSLNPFIVSRDFLSPLIAVTSTFLFLNYSTLTIISYFFPVHDFKLVITLEVFIGLWALLLSSTIKQNSSNIYTGDYPISIVYFLYSISTILGLFGISIATPRKEIFKPLHKSYGSIQSVESENTNVPYNEIRNEASPLLSNSISSEPEGTQILPGNNDIDEVHPEHVSFSYDWSLQFLILVPINFLVSYVSVWLILDATNQTIQESLKSQYFVYSVIFVSSIALSLPFLSFAYKLNYIFGLLLVVSIFYGTTSSILKASFSLDAPLKLRFSQSINLDSAPTIPTVELFSREGLISDLVSDLPSLKNNGEAISCEYKPDGNELCTYTGLRPYLIDGTEKENSFDNYLQVDILKTGSETVPSPYAPLTAEISINAVENRFCSLSFNTTSYKAGSFGKSPVRIFTYYHGKNLNDSKIVSKYASVPSGPSKDADGNDVFKYVPGIDELHLHRLNWSQNSYHIGLQWIPKWLEDGEEQEPLDSLNNKLGVQISCYWGEYDDVSIVDGVPKRKVPAFDELLEYSPLSTSFSNRYEGLVKVDKYITL